MKADDGERSGGIPDNMVVEDGVLVTQASSVVPSMQVQVPVLVPVGHVRPRSPGVG